MPPLPPGSVLCEQWQHTHTHLSSLLQLLIILRAWALLFSARIVALARLGELFLVLQVAQHLRNKLNFYTAMCIHKPVQCAG